MTRRIYIAGPMTGMPYMNFPAFNEAARHLRALGFEVVNPVDLNPDPGAEWVDCMRADIKALVDCNAVALLPGWERSRGATLEFTIAQNLQLSVGTLDAWLLSGGIN